MDFIAKDFTIILTSKTKTVEVILNNVTKEKFSFLGSDDWKDIEIDGVNYDFHYLDDEDGETISIYDTYIDEDGFLNTDTSKSHNVNLQIN